MSQDPTPRNDALPAARVDRSSRRRVEVRGPDRAKFLHNLTTNEVKRLPIGRGCEAFVTSPQGKTIGYVTLLAAEDHILVRTDPSGMELVLPHLRKYGIFDDVMIEDRTDETFELHLLGSSIDERVRRTATTLPEEAAYAHIVTEIAGQPVRLVRESPAGVRGLTVIGQRAHAPAVIAAIEQAAGALALIELPEAEFEALRIEAGTPVFGADVTDKNLPQEFARDDRAISFVKGCYLGQETVARIDALGHVNQVLRGLCLEPGSACPARGAGLEIDGKRIGTVTSAADSPARGGPVALAMVRAAQAAAGTKVRVELPGGAGTADAAICDLPFPPRA